MKNKDDTPNQEAKDNAPESVAKEVYSLQVKYLEKGIQAINKNLDEIKGDVKTLDAKLDTKTDALGAKIDSNFKFMIGMWLTTIATIIGLYFKH